MHCKARHSACPLRRALSRAGAVAVGLSIGMLAAAQAEPARQLPDRVDFELAGESRFVRLSDLPEQPSVINFWRSDCPPCVREMPLLARLAETRAGRVNIVTVALQPPSETRRAPAGLRDALRAPLMLLHGPREPRGILARFGNPNGVLPYTLVVTPDRRPCARHSGELSEQWLNEAIRLCQNG